MSDRLTADLAEILAKNPQIDLQQLGVVKEVIEKNRTAGVKRNVYGLLRRSTANVRQSSGRAFANKRVR